MNRGHTHSYTHTHIPGRPVGGFHLCLFVYNNYSFDSQQVAELLKVLEVRRGQERDDDFIECNNMTLINLVLKTLGSIHERNLTAIMLIIQV